MNFGIQKKLALSFSIFLAIVLGSCCWSIVSHVTRLARENIQEQQFALTELIARSIDDKLGTNLGSIANVAQSIPAPAFTEPDRAQAILDSHKDMLSIFDDGLMLLDSKFSVIAEIPFSTGRRGTRTDWLGPFLKKVADFGLPDISTPYTSPKTKAPFIVMAVPIDGLNKIHQGFLVGSINLTKDYFIQELMGYKIANKGYLYLFNTERTMILHPDRNRIMRQDIPKGANKLLDRAIAGFEGSGETINSRGIPQIASFKRLKIVDWILATVYPQEEAYAPIKRLRSYIITAAALITVFSIVLIWLLTRRITANFTSFTEQVLVMKEHPESRHQIRIEHTDEVSLLAATFNELLHDFYLARESLDKMTRTDHLTGLHNRRHLELEAPYLIAASERQNAPSALLLVDIDLFKKVNDLYGHDAGDAVLVHVARLLHQQVRPYDMVVRLGGEEFLLVLPMATTQVALNVAERIRSSIHDTPVTCNHEKISIEVSIGVFVSKEIHNLQEAIARADAALYQAKNNGRNQVCLATDKQVEKTVRRLSLVSHQAS